MACKQLGRTAKAVVFVMVGGSILIFEWLQQKTVCNRVSMFELIQVLLYTFCIEKIRTRFRIRF